MKIKDYGNSIEVSYHGKRILVVEDTEFGVEAYDCVNYKVLDTKRQWLAGVYEEVRPYLYKLVAQLDNPSNEWADTKRREVLNANTSALAIGKKGVGNNGV